MPDMEARLDALERALLAKIRMERFRQDDAWMSSRECDMALRTLIDWEESVKKRLAHAQ